MSFWKKSFSKRTEILSPCSLAYRTHTSNSLQKGDLLPVTSFTSGETIQ